MAEIQQLILETMQQLQTDMSAVKVSLGKLETSVETLCRERVEQQGQHTTCRHDLDRQLADNQRAHDEIWQTLNRLMSWGKAVAILGTAAVLVLTVLNILQAVGVQL